MKKNIDFWKGVLEKIPDAYKRWFKEEKEYLEKYLTRDCKVLEVGCGEGRTLNDITHITKNITGIDHDEKAVNDAKNNFKNNPEIKIIQAKAENLPFENKTFDFVICMTTFANFAQKKYKILKEMKRVLKDNGSIIISVFSEYALPERLKIYSELNAPIKEIKDNGTVIFDESLGDNISEQFTKEQLESIFKKAKLKINNIKKGRMAYLCNLTKIK
ncbi:MAG: class I SAM-dependent methyltransferase [Nanoarchaeota archaeon]|nr:class I SAM-dependent methyltransferase [Nanoarchaeota archaeon]